MKWGPVEKPSVKAVISPFDVTEGKVPQDGKKFYTGAILRDVTAQSSQNEYQKAIVKQGIAEWNKQGKNATLSQEVKSHMVQKEKKKLRSGGRRNQGSSVKLSQRKMKQNCF